MLELVKIIAMAIIMKMVANVILFIITYSTEIAIALGSIILGILAYYVAYPIL